MRCVSQPGQKLSDGILEQFKRRLRAAGFHLVYEVRDQQVQVLVVAMGKQERNAVYRQTDQH